MSLGSHTDYCRTLCLWANARLSGTQYLILFFPLLGGDKGSNFGINFVDLDQYVAYRQFL